VYGKYSHSTGLQEERLTLTFIYLADNIKRDAKSFYAYVRTKKQG